MVGMKVPTNANDKLDIPANRGKEMVSDGGFATHLKTFDVADLFDGAMVLLNMPMLVMLFCEGFPVNVGKLIFIGQEDGVMARLVFQPRPKQLHMTEFLEPDHRPGYPAFVLVPIGLFPEKPYDCFPAQRANPTDGF